MPKYRDIADHLRTRIDNSEFPAGSTLPRTSDLVTEYRASKHTVRAAVAVLVDEGRVIARRRYGSLVRDRSSVVIPFSRYQGALASQGRHGPFQAACAAQGLTGVMRATGVQHVHDPAVAALLQLPEEADLVCRQREALIGNQVVQVQSAWYPRDVAETARLDRPGTVNGGIYRALAAAGLRAAEADERITARMPTKPESSLLGTGTRIPVLTIQRVSRTETGRAVELLRVVTAADRMELSYEALRLPD